MLICFISARTRTTMIRSILYASLLSAAFYSAQAQFVQDITPPCAADADCLGNDIGATCNLVTLRCTQPICPAANVRRPDAICNNRSPGNAYYGSTRELQRRVANGSAANLNSQRTSLDISDLMFNTFVQTPNFFGFSNLLVIFGQFVDHDITLIDIVATTRTLRGTGGTITEFTFPLSERVGGIATTPNPDFVNAISAYLDLTQVYGGDNVRNTRLRDITGGRMRSQMVNGQELLPFITQLAQPIGMAMDNIPNTFAAGDVRANEQLILTAFHTLFLREHNRLAAIFTAQGLNNDAAYEAARARNIAQYQNIVFNEFLPALLGPNPLPAYSGYNATLNAEVSLTFSTALYRVGHSGVANNVLAIDRNGVRVDRTLADAFFAPDMFLAQNDPVGAFLLGSKNTCHERFDLEMQDSLRRLLFQNTLNEAADLGALNIERSRDHQLESYNDYRASLGLPAVTMNTLSNRQCVTRDLNAMFNNVDEIPNFVGGLAETPMANSQLGETMTAAIVEQFLRFRDGDRFYFENRNADGAGFNDAQLSEIRSTSLAEIIKTNTFVSANDIGRNAFESEQCCFTGGNSSPNLMCVRAGGAVSLQTIDVCLAEDMTASGAAFYPGTMDRTTGVFYDCACTAANTNVNGAKSISTAAAFAATVGATLMAL